MGFRGESVTEIQLSGSDERTLGALMSKVFRYVFYCLLAVQLIQTNASAASRRYRLMWTNNPATTATVGWEQFDDTSGTNALVLAGAPVVLYSTNPANLPATHAAAVPPGAKTHGVDREVNGLADQASGKGMVSNFSRLTGLLPDTRYYYVIRDAEMQSRRFWFLTAPSTPKEFSFIAGGDSRNDAPPIGALPENVAANAGRVAGNAAVAAIRPLFVVFNGDATFSDTPAEWQAWFDDWQTTITNDGRIFPLLAARGNHEYIPAGITSMFDFPDASTTNDPASYYFALSFGGSLLRFYTLNSEITEAGAQGAWLAGDLAENATSHDLLMAGYHKPMRPHEREKTEGTAEYEAWASLFHQYGVDLVVESDSHCAKRTVPVRPSTAKGSYEGFIRDDLTGTVFIGEGCWGAPLRPADDKKPWTLASGSFNHFDHIRVVPAGAGIPAHLQVRTVLLDSIASMTPRTETQELSAPSELPQGTRLWQPATGEVLRIPFAANAVVQTTPSTTGSFWRYNDDGYDLAATPWKSAAYDDSSWSYGPTQLGYGESDQATVMDEFQANGTTRVITTYLRKSFEFAQVAEVSALELELLCDDGAIVYLNGTEILRRNLPTGTVTATTPATASQVKPAESAYTLHNIANPAALLVEGVNIIAVELHQSGQPGLPSEPTDADASFDLRLKATRNLPPNPPAAPALTATGLSPTQIALEWDAVPGADSYYLERRDGAGLWQVVSASIPGNVTRHVDGSLGSDTTFFYRLRFADGGNYSAFSNEASATTLTDLGGVSPVIARGGSWNYLATVNPPASPPTGWQTTAFAGAWPAGTGPLGFNSDLVATTLGDTDNTSYYFRRSFQVSDASAVTSLTLSLLADDGAVVYLNGTEVLRDNMPAGPTPITASSFALAPRNGSEQDAYRSFTLDRSLLVNGTNTVAVAVHQAAEPPAPLGSILGSTGPDLLFDASLSVTVDAMIPIVTIAASGVVDEETGGGGRFIVQRTGTPVTALQVGVNGAGSATDSDYQASPALAPAVTLPIGANSTAVTIRGVFDRMPEGMENLTAMLLTSPSYVIGPDSSANLTIRDSLYDAFKQTFYGRDANISGTADTDSDSVVTLLEWAFGMNPTLSDVDLLPRISKVEDNGQTYAEIRYRQRTDSKRLTYTIQHSSDLLGFSDATAMFAPSGAPQAIAGTGIEEVVMRSNQPISSSNPRAFFRVQVTLNDL